MADTMANPLSEGVIFWHLPAAVAQSFQTALIWFSLCLGALGLELLTHIMFDIRLLAKPGWTHLPKLGSRLAYLLCRYAALLYLVLAIVFLTTPGLHCSSWARGLNVMSMLSLDAVDFIFVQRTLALYSWDKKVMIPLVALYVITAGMSVPAIVWFGYGYNIPDGRGGVVDFCAYQTYRFATSHFPVFIVYKSFAVILDTSIFLTTLHKLSDGGIPRLASAIWHKIIRKEDVPAPQLVRGQLGLTLVKQGFHYYVMLEVVRIIFLALYYGAPEVEYQVMGSALLCAVEPVLAGAIFRNASVRRQRQSGVMWRGRYEGSNSNDTGTPPVTPTTPRRLGIPGTPGGANIMGGGQSDGVLVTRISRVSMSNDANGGDVSGDESDEHQGGGGHGPSNSKAARQWRAVQQRNAAALKVESPNANPSLTHSYHHRKRDSRATARASTGLGFTRSFDAATDLSTPKAARFQGLFSPSLNHRSSDIELGTPTTLVDGEESRFGSPKMPLSPAPSETPYFYLRRESPRTPPNEVADNHDVVQRLSSSYPSLGSRASASSGHLALNESQLWTTNEEERRSESRATADTNGSGKDTVRDFRFVN